MRNNLNRPQPSLLLAVMLIPLIRSLIASLPVGNESAWFLNDILRAAAYMSLSFFVASIVPYSALRLKCLLSALAGYSLADFIICVVWYSFSVDSYLLACLLQIAGFVGMAAFCLLRSFDKPNDIVVDWNIYCLRKKPDSFCSFLLALIGLDDAFGAYAIYCNGYVYKFRMGFLVKMPFSESVQSKYQIKSGVKYSKELERELDEMLGTRWNLMGKNCITLLGGFWSRNAA